MGSVDSIRVGQFPYKEARAWWLMPTETRQQLTRPWILPAACNPSLALTSHFPEETVLDCRAGTSFILPTQVKWKYDSMDVAHALNPMQQTQTAARKSLPTQPRRMRGKPGISFWNEVTEGKDAVMANEWFVS